MRGLPQRTCFSSRLLSRKFQAQASSSSPPWGRGWVRGVMQETIFVLHPLT